MYNISRMDITDSLKPILFIQKLYLLTIVDFYRHDIRCSKTTAALTALGILIVFSFYVYVGINALTAFEKLAQENPLDQSFFSTAMLGVPGLVIILSVIGITFAIIDYRKEIKFYRILVKIDSILLDIVDLQPIYRSNYYSSVLLSSGLIVLFLLYGIQYLSIGKLSNRLMILIMFSFGFMTSTFYVTTAIFITFILIIIGRLQLISSLTENITKLNDFIKLAEIEKLLTTAIDQINATFSVKQLYVLAFCWFELTVELYLLLLNVVFWSERSVNVIVTLLASSTPALFMVLCTSY